MSIERYFVHDVTVVHPALIDGRTRGQVPDWDGATRTATKGWLARTTETENRVGRDALVSEWTLRLPVDTVVDGRDRIEAGASSPAPGAVFEIIGPPYKAPTPYGPHHVRCPLRLVEG